MGGGACGGDFGGGAGGGAFVSLFIRVSYRFLMRWCDDHVGLLFVFHIC